MKWVDTLQSEACASAIRVGVSAGLVVGAGVYAWAFQTRRRAGVWACGVWFTALAITAGAAYVRFGADPWIGGYNSHEVFHYYLGSKYHQEVGYGNLYACATLADWEGEQLFRKVSNLRDVNTQRHVSRRTALADAHRYLQPFSAERWRSFKSDVQALVGENHSRTRLLTDLGYVASPFWTSWASPLMQVIPLRPNHWMVLLCSADHVLLLLLILLIWKTCGWTPAMVGAAFFFVSFAIDSWTIRGSIFRLDWLMALAGAVCCLRAGHHKTAGLLAAYSVLVRVFPLLFFWGLAVNAIVQAWRARGIQRGHLAFFGSLVLSGLILAAPSLIQSGGFGCWQEFFARMSHHSELVRVKRVGFSAAATYGGESSRDDYVTADRKMGREAWSAEKKEANVAVKPMLRGVSLLVLVIVGWLSLRQPDESSAALGMLALYFTADVSWYYYMALLVPCLVFAMRMDRWAGAAAVMVLSAGNLIAHYMDLGIRFEVRKYAFTSWLMLVVLVTTAVLLFFMRERVKGEARIVTHGS